MLLTSPSPVLDLNRPPVEIKIRSCRQDPTNLADDILKTYIEKFKPPETAPLPLHPEPHQPQTPISISAKIVKSKITSSEENRHNEINSFTTQPSTLARLRMARIRLVATFISACESIAMFFIIFSCLIIFSPLIPSGI